MTTHRRKLLQILTLYADAIVVKDVSTIPVAPDVRIRTKGTLTIGNAPVCGRTQGGLRMPYRRALVDANTSAELSCARVKNETVPRGASVAEIVSPRPVNGGGMPYD